MNQLFYSIAGGIVHQIRREKRPTISEVIVRVKRNIKQNKNWIYFNFSVESSSFIFKNFITENFKPIFEGWNRPVCHLFGFTRVSICQNLLHFTLGPWSESWRRWCRVSFRWFFSFSASFKHSNPREKVGKLSSFWDWWADSLFVSIIVTKCSIFPRDNNGRSREKKFWRSDLLALSACTIEILSTLTYTEFDCVALLAMS